MDGGEAGEEEAVDAAPGGRGDPGEGKPKDENVEARKREHEARRQASRDFEKKKKRVQELEASIAKLEEELATLRAALLEDPKGDWAAVAEKAERERAASRTLETMVEEWSRLSEQVAEGEKARA